MFGFMKRNENHFLAIGAIFRNEKEYILEWIAWHQSQGINKFIIYDNESDDGSFELLLLLEKHSVIDLYTIEKVEKSQIKAYEKILSTYKKKIDLIAFIDADEFFMPYGEKKAVDHIKELFSDESVGAVAFNWRTFGSSGHVKHLDGFVIDRFTKAASDNRPRNHYIKSVYRPNLVEDIYPHRAVLNKNYRYINAFGDDVLFASFENGKKGKEGIKPLLPGHTSGVTNSICDARMRINHYAIKSREEFDKKKKRKGSCMFGTEQVKSEGYFKTYDWNDLDLSINNYHYSDFVDCYERLLALIEGK